MRNLKNGLFFALEEDAVVVPQEPTEVVPETQVEVETAAGEMTEQVGEIEQIDEAAVDAQDGAETLGEIKDTMEESVEKGEGLDETAAEIAEVAVEAICARLGMKSKSKAMPAMESFGAKSSRVGATKIAIEETESRIKKIWDAIVKAMAAMWEKVKTFIGMLFKNKETLKKHLIALQGSLKDLKEGEGKEGVKGSSAKAFNVGGKADFETAKKIIGDSTELIDIVTGVGAKTVKLAEDIGKAISRESTSDLCKEFSVELKGAFKPLGVVEGDRHGNFVGGKSIAVKAEENTFSLQVEELSAKAPETAALLTGAQMSTLLDQAIVLTTKIGLFEKAQKEFETAVNKVKSVKYQGEGTNESNDALAAARALNSVIAKLASSVPSLSFQAAKATGDYVSACIKAHKGGAKADAKPAEEKPADAKPEGGEAK